MIKPILIVLMLIASIKMGFANDQCHQKNDKKQIQSIEKNVGPITQIRNPQR